MFRFTARAAQFASLLLVSTALVYFGTAGKAEARDSHVADSGNSVGLASAGQDYLPEAGGRVIRRTDQVGQVADSGNSVDLPGVGEGYVPEAGGRVIRRTHQAGQFAESGKSFGLPGVGEGYVPEAGGRVIRRTDQAADGGTAMQQTSVKLCTTEPQADNRC